MLRRESIQNVFAAFRDRETPQGKGIILWNCNWETNKTLLNQGWGGSKRSSPLFTHNAPAVSQVYCSFSIDFMVVFHLYRGTAFRHTSGSADGWHMAVILSFGSGGEWKRMGFRVLLHVYGSVCVFQTSLPDETLSGEGWECLSFLQGRDATVRFDRKCRQLGCQY